MDMQSAIKAVTEDKNLSSDEMKSVMQLIMTGEATPAQVGGFLIGLRMKGETVEEVAAAASVMRDLSTRVDVLNRIAKAAALAERLSVGVIVTGPISLADLAKLSDIESIEDYFIGHEVISKAVMFGLEDSIAEFKSEVNRF